MRFFLSLVLFAFLSACAATTPSAKSASASLKEFKVYKLEDWTAARDTACTLVNGEPVLPLDCACTTAVVNELTTNADVANPTIVGPVSAFVAGRLVASKLQGGLPQAIKQGCGGVALDLGEQTMTLGAFLSGLAR